MIAFFTTNEGKEKRNIIKETAPLVLASADGRQCQWCHPAGQTWRTRFSSLPGPLKQGRKLKLPLSPQLTYYDLPPQGSPAEDKHHKLSQFVCDTQLLKWKHHGIKYKRPEWRMQRNGKASRFKLHSLCAIRYMLKKTSIQCILRVLKGQTQEEGKPYLKPEAFILFSIEIIRKPWMCKYTKRSKLYKNSLRKTIQDKASQSNLH